LYLNQKNFTYHDRKEAFIKIILCLLQNNIVELVNRQNNTEYNWKEPILIKIKKLRNWLDSQDENVFDENYWHLFYNLEYPFLKWLKPYPITEKDLSPECYEK
jgi:hypothetical protein